MPVLTFLKTWYPNDKLHVEQLSQKLVMLLALATAQRVQTLSKICINNIIISTREIQIKIPDRTKTTALNRYQPCLNIPFCTIQPELYVASTIIAYLERTETLRNDKDNKLFITYRKPYRIPGSK